MGWCRLLLGWAEAAPGVWAAEMVAREVGSAEEVEGAAEEVEGSAEEVGGYQGWRVSRAAVALAPLTLYSCLFLERWSQSCCCYLALLLAS